MTPGTNLPGVYVWLTTMAKIVEAFWLTSLLWLGWQIAKMVFPKHREGKSNVEEDEDWY